MNTATSSTDVAAASSADRRSRTLLRLLAEAEEGAIAFAAADLPLERDRSIRRLLETVDGSDVKVRVLHLEEPLDDLLMDVLALEPPPADGEVLLITGFEHSISSQAESCPALERLEAFHKEIRKLPCSVILFLPDYALRRLRREAKALWANRSAHRVLEAAPPRLVSLYRPIWTDLYEPVEGSPSARARELPVLRSLLADTEVRGEGRDREKADLYQDIALLLQRTGRLREALQHGEAARHHADASGSLQHRSAALLLLGGIQRDLGRYEQARLLLEDGLALMLPIYGDSHPNVAAARTSLASVLLLARARAADIAAAEKHLSSALAAVESTYEARHPAVATACGNLAMGLAAAGDLDGAAEYLDRCLAIDHELFGDAHLRAAVGRNNRAALHLALGDLDEALALATEALEILGEVLEEDHFLFASVLGNLALLCHASGETGQAVNLYHGAATMRAETLGPRHPDLAINLHGMGLCLIDDGSPEKGKEILEQSLEIALRALGEGHPHTADLRQRLQDPRLA